MSFFDRFKRRKKAQNEEPKKDRTEKDFRARKQEFLAREKKGSGAVANSKSSHRVPYKKGDLIGGKYEVYRELGHGGFGIVYLTYYHETESVYALKTFLDRYLEDAETRKLFWREASVWTDLERHPYIVRAYFVDEIAGRLYVAMEYIAPNEQGLNTLGGYLKQRPPDLAQSLRWAIQFCYGMEYAYSRGVHSHRDIKPDNIMISTDKAVKITDFGLASVLDASKALMEGKCCGTPTHMPPEQFISTARCDERSDIYSFGIVLYQMATRGRPPFLAPPPRNKSEEETKRYLKSMYKLQSEASVPHLDSPLFPIIQRCLQKEPEKRFQTFKELRSDLQALLKGHTGETVKPPERKELEAWEWGNKGVSLRSLGRFDEAIRCYDRALEINPQYAEAWFGKAFAEDNLGLRRDAAQSYRRFIKLAPAQNAEHIRYAHQRLRELK